MNWLCKNTYQHSLLKEDPSEDKAGRKDCKTAQQAENSGADCSDTPLLHQDRPYNAEQDQDGGWQWSHSGASPTPASSAARRGSDGWHDWETTDAWEPVTPSSPPAPKATASSSKSPPAKSPPTKSPSAKSPSTKASSTKSSKKKTGDEKLLIDFGEEGGHKAHPDWDSGWDDDWDQLDSAASGSRGYQRISTKAD